jgi:hypothetical protein
MSEGQRNRTGLRLRYWLEQSHGVRFYLGLLVFEIGLRPRRYRWRWGISRV